MASASSHKNPFPRFLWLAVLFFVLLTGSLELAARSPLMAKVSSYRSMGNYDYQFEIKWFHLQDYIEKNGGVDIIILGSSIVNTGVDPDVVAQAYYEQTGLRLRIFNFGIEGMTIAPNSRVAEILVEEYHPALLVYATEMRDFIAGNGLETETRFLSDPWIRYRSGDFNWPGWTIDHSAALQHYLPYRNWTSAGFYEEMSQFTSRLEATSPSGYERDLGIGQGIDKMPDPNDPAETANFQAYGNFQVAPSRMLDLKRILDLQHDGRTSVLIVEMPVYPTFYAYVGGEEVHKQFQTAIFTFIRDEGAPFFPAGLCNEIPLQGRSNRWHLNFLGAPPFSHCIGEQLAFLAAREELDFIRPGGGR